MGPGHSGTVRLAAAGIVAVSLGFAWETYTFLVRPRSMIWYTGIIMGGKVRNRPRHSADLTRGVLHPDGRLKVMMSCVISPKAMYPTCSAG